MSVSCEHPQSQLHLALFYEGDEEYLDGVMTFIEPALAAGDPVAVAVPGDRVRLLRARLGDCQSRIELLDMSELGRNPARIIPEIERILAGCAGARLHYVGEPIWGGRSDEEIQEATKHEALINLAWPGAQISVLCPYDVAALSPDVVADAERTHPYLIRRGEIVPSGAYREATIPQGCDDPLPAPPPSTRSITFTADDLHEARALVSEVAQRAGLGSGRTADLLLVASELGTNAIRHGRGGGILRVWSRPNAVACQVEDRGQIGDPLAGRKLPSAMAIGGRGLWLVNQLCDLVQARTSARGTTVRAHMSLG